MTTYITSGLTTAFTPAPSCYSKGLTGTAWAESFGEYTTTVNYDHLDECYAYKTSLYYSYGTFSPGMCPGGYTTALSSSASGAVAAACCPTNYDKVSEDAYCTSKRTTSMSIDCLYPSSTSASATCSPGLVGPGHAVQFAIHVMYASSDLTRFPVGYTPGQIGDNGAVTAAAFAEHVPGATISILTSGPTISIPTSDSTPTGPTSAPSSGGANSSNGGGSLTSGAKAGIGIGVAVVVLALLGGFFLLWRRRRKGKSPKHSSGPTALSDDGHYNDKEVVTPGYAPHSVEKHYHCELDGQVSRINELAGFQEQQPQELPHYMSTSPPMQHVAPAPAIPPMPSQSIPAESDMTATTLGPVSTQLDNSQHSKAGQSPPPTKVSTNGPSGPTAASQVTAQNIELRYLEEEERKLRVRKEAILASQKAQ